MKKKLTAVVSVLTTVALVVTAVKTVWTEVAAFRKIATAIEAESTGPTAQDKREWDLEQWRQELQARVDSLEALHDE